MRVKVGCCGFPGGMGRYFSQFDLAEVQQTFYKLPQLETVLKWRRQAPSGFEFTIKAWQLITHSPSSPTYRKAGIKVPQGEVGNYGFFRPTEEVLEAWRRTREVARALECRVIVFQCPPSFQATAENAENLRRFFASVEREFIFVWEPRGGWAPDTIAELCRELDLVHCVDPFEARPLYGKITYYRLHGGPGYRHKYSDEELAKLKTLLKEGENYVMFNNIYMGEDAHRFRSLLEGR